MKASRVHVQAARVSLLAITAMAFGWTVSSLLHGTAPATGGLDVASDHHAGRTQHHVHAGQDHTAHGHGQDHQHGDGRRHEPTPTARGYAPVTATTLVVADASVPIDDAREASTPHERHGRLEHLHGAWSEAPLDAERTTRTRALVEDLLARYDIAPLSQSVACTESLCRCRLLFRAKRDAWALGRIRERPVDEIALGVPEELSDGWAVAIYFPTEDHRLPPRPELRAEARP